MPTKIFLNYHLVYINGLNIEYVTEFNFLGLILDNNLNWKAHTNFISVKICSRFIIN